MLAYRAGAPILVRQFLADVARVSAALRAGGSVVNVCGDRYRFAVGLAAALVTGKVSLLPSTRTPEVIAHLTSFAPDAFCLTDEDDCDVELPQVGKTVKAGKDARGAGMIINVSRALIFASQGADFAKAARAKAEELHGGIIKAL